MEGWGQVGAEAILKLKRVCGLFRGLRKNVETC